MAKKTEMKEIVVRGSVRWRGVCEAAKRLGMTQGHFGRLVRGERSKKDFDKILAANHITVIRD